MFVLPDKNTIKLLRIPFSLLLMPLFILALSQATSLHVGHAIAAFLIIHLLVYPASNGYNSYVDRDETSIGGLEHPPLPTKALFHLTLLLDVFAVLLSFFFVNWLFALCILAYILASRAYSARQIRLKKYALAGFLIVVIFQGAFTYFMCSIGLSENDFVFSFPNCMLLCACSLQIAGVYPLTQIYQHEADLADGVTTLSYKLGYRGTFLFTAIMFAFCNVCYFLYFDGIGRANQFYVLQLFFLPVIAFFVYWFLQVIKNTMAANFKNTMRMNLIAAVCMNACFLVLYFLNR
ncbi:MAG: UbiA family prenyltransferase [Bacteroidia bacterium]